MTIQKQFFTLLFCSIFLFLNAQNEKSGIFKIYIHIEPELVTEINKKYTDRKFLSEVSTSAVFPENLLDSIKVISELSLSSKFNSEVECIYKKSKKGKVLSTIGANGELEGMPVNTLKNAILTNDKDQYISISAYITSGGKKAVLDPKWNSKVKPMIKVFVKVQDVDKKVIWKKDAVLQDFSELRSASRTRGTIVRTKRETLSPEDIFIMYELALSEVLK
tara:strand:- start:1794 stop:2453 length:660 start_codon:yes stop_codon:yes gene_type:complete